MTESVQLSDGELHILEVITSFESGRACEHDLINKIYSLDTSNPLRAPLEIQSLLKNLDKEGFITPRPGSNTIYEINPKGRATLRRHQKVLADRQKELDAMQKRIALSEESLKAAQEDLAEMRKQTKVLTQQAEAARQQAEAVMQQVESARKQAEISERAAMKANLDSKKSFRLAILSIIVAILAWLIPRDAILGFLAALLTAIV